MHIPRPSNFIDSVTHMSYRQLFQLWIGLTCTFALCYFALSYTAGHHGPTELENLSIEHRLFNSLYYSIITATSTGYGDIVPQGFSKFLASLQSMLSLFVFAIFVSKLLSRQQEIALREVHKLSFEDIYHNLREELFIARKDLDVIQLKVEAGQELNEDDWENMTVVYQSVGTILREIPDFYDTSSNLYTIDPGREELLHESVHRTLHRINQVLDAMSKHKVDWVSQEESITELRELMKVIDDSTASWRTKSPYGKDEAFESIMHLKDSMHARMEKALPVQTEEDEN